MSRIMKLLSALAPCWLGLLLVAGSPAAGSEGAGKIGPDVRSALAINGTVLLSVALVPSEGTERTPAALRQRVAQEQETVLAALPAGTCRIIRRYRYVPGLDLMVTSEGALQALEAHPAVLRADRDGVGRTDLNESRPRVGADLAQAAGYSGSGRKVAILDTGVYAAHADLAPAVVEEHCFCTSHVDGSGCCPGGGMEESDPGSAADAYGHGTHVAGIVGGRGQASPLGIAPGVSLVALRVSDAGGYLRSADTVAAMEWILDHHPDTDTLNMSYYTDDTGGTVAGPCDGVNAAVINLAAAVNLLRDNGILSVASSGNSGDAQAMHPPACIQNVVAVGSSHDQNDTISSFSCSGQSLDLLAPGEWITAAWTNGGQIAQVGTSMAAPHVAAAAAVLRGKDPLASPASLERALKTSRTWLTDTRNGLTRPRLDIPTALGALDAADTLVPPGIWSLLLGLSAP